MPPKKSQKQITESQRSTSSLPMRKQKAWLMPYTPLIVTPTPRAQALRERVGRRKFASVVGPAITEDRKTFESYCSSQSPLPKQQNLLPQRSLPMPMPMGIPKHSPKQSEKEKSKVDEKQSLLVVSNQLPKTPDINLLVSFIEEAGELADGHRQNSLMEEIIAQFGAYLLYVDDLETKVKNIKSAYDRLLKVKRLEAQ